MDIISMLLSKAKKGLQLQVTLISGSTFNGEITDIVDDGIILQDKEKLTAVSFKSIIVWQLNIPAEGDIAAEETIIEPEINDAESVYDNNVTNILNGFNPEKAEHCEIILKNPITKAPPILLQVENESEKKKWDSILSRYQNALKNNDSKLIGSLADELIAIGNSNQESGVFYYNAACFKAKDHNYPDAGELFHKAFSIEKKSDYAYNAACTYLKSGDSQKALAYLGIYFCMEYLTQDENMWNWFCSITRATNEYHVFDVAFKELISKYYQHNVENDSLIFLLKSALYVYIGVKDLRDAIIAFSTSIEDADSEISEEKLDKFIDDYTLLTDNNELFHDNTKFDYLYGLLNGNSVKDINLESQIAPEDLADEEHEEDVIDISLSENHPAFLRLGKIYRTIPPYKYGFLKDDNANSYHFKYDVIFDNIGYLDNVTDYDPIPILFKSIPSATTSSSTDETATFICSYKTLDNMIQLAQNFSKERDYPNAILELENVLLYDPDHTEANDLKDRWTTIYENKYKIQADVINFQPKEPAEWKAKGDLLLKLGMYGEAIDAFNKSSANMTASSSALYGQGIAYLKTRRYEEAIDYLNKAIEKNSFYYHANHALSIAYNRLGKYAESVKHSKYVLAVRPDHKDSWAQKAFSLSRLGEYEESLHAYNMVMALDPEDWVTLSKLSSVLAKMNDPVKAMRCVDKVLHHIPDHSDSLFTKGYIYQKENRLPEALEYFQKSLDSNPDNVKALTKKAFVLAMMGEIDDAIEVIQDALNHNMNNSKTWYYKGVVHHCAGDYEEAINAYQYSLDLKPGEQRVIGCKKRAERKLDPSFEPVLEKFEDYDEAGSDEEIDDLISELNQKFSMS